MVHRICGALSVTLWLLTGCSTVTPRVQERPPPTEILTSPAPLWQHLQTRRQAIRTLKGLAQVDVDTGEKKTSLDDTVMAVQLFAAMRLEGIGPFGQPLFLLIANAQQLALYVPREKRLLTGVASAHNLLRLFGVALAPKTLHYILIGDVPIAMAPSGGDFTYLAEDNLYRWQGLVPAQRQYYRIWFEPYDLHPVRFEIQAPPGHVVLQVTYDAFQQLSGVKLPQHIVMQQPASARRAVWRYREVQLNPEVAPDLFRMRVPAGTERIDLDHGSTHAHITLSAP